MAQVRGLGRQVQPSNLAQVMARNGLGLEAGPELGLGVGTGLVGGGSTFNTAELGWPVAPRKKEEKRRASSTVDSVIAG